MIEFHESMFDEYSPLMNQGEARMKPDLETLLKELEEQDPALMSQAERLEWIAALEYVIERIEAVLACH